MFSLENDHLQINVSPRGAELNRLFSKDLNREYLWSGDPAFWAKHSPVLFPVVGTLKNDTYHFENKTYKLTRHGFARDMDFELARQSDTSLTLSLQNNETTLLVFPFAFRLDITYTLEASTLHVKYEVFNTGTREMYFSIGGHPAFRIPFEEHTAFEDYYLEFSEKETAGRWPISRHGLIEALPLALLQDTNVLHLSRDLFLTDAIVFKYLRSTSLKLKCRTSAHGLKFTFEHFPFLGIWSAKNADFVCIEPWCGIADSVASHQQLTEKEGINMITPGQAFDRTWSVELF